MDHGYVDNSVMLARSIRPIKIPGTAHVPFTNTVTASQTPCKEADEMTPLTILLFTALPESRYQPRNILALLNPCFHLSCIAVLTTQ